MNSLIRLKTRSRILAAIAGILFFFLILGVFAAWSIHGELEALRTGGLQKLDLYQKILGNEIRRHEYLPLVMAQNGDVVDFLLHQGDSVRQERLNRYFEQVSGQTDASAIYLLNLDGLTIASSNWTSDKSYVGQNYAFRPYFQLARSGRPGHYYAIGATTRIPGMFLSYPVLSGDEVVGVMAAKISMKPLEQSWARGGPERVFLTDSNGVIISSSTPEWKLRTLGALPPDYLRLLRKERKYMDVELLPLGMEPVSWFPGISDLVRVSSEGVERGAKDFAAFDSYYIFQKLSLPGTRWTIYICSDLSPLISSLFDAIAIAAPVSLSLILLLFYLIDHRLYLQEKKRYQLKSKKKLEIGEAERRAIIHHTRAALVIVAPGGEIESFNPTAERFFGSAEEEVKGRSLMQLLDDSDEFELARKFFKGEFCPIGDFQFEGRGRRRDGAGFPIDMTVSDIALHRGLRYIVTIHDITRQKKAEEELRQAFEEQDQRIRERTVELRDSNEKLRHEIVERKRAEAVLKETQEDLIQASKLAALGQMATGIVHELNQPLTAIRTFTASSRLLLEKNRTEQVGDNFTRVLDLTDRMAGITGQLKIFASKSRGVTKRIPLNESLNQVLVLMDERIREGEVQVLVSMPEMPIMIEGDALRLEQVLINLIANAVDAMKEVETRKLEIETFSGPGHIRLSVRDNGPGIAGDHIGQVFDPFFTTKEVGEGMGLGLSISYGIIRDLGGTIKVGNRPEGGAEFTIEMPRV